MARPKKCRHVRCDPAVTSFKPSGVPRKELQSIELRLDELEAIRLADLEGLYFDAGAEMMGVSRQTFGRLVETAHQKVADALLNGKNLDFIGGPVLSKAKTVAVRLWFSP